MAGRAAGRRGCARGWGPTTLFAERGRGSPGSGGCSERGSWQRDGDRDHEAESSELNALPTQYRQPMCGNTSIVKLGSKCGFSFTPDLLYPRGLHTTLVPLTS